MVARRICVQSASRCATSIHFLIPKMGEVAQTLRPRKEPFWGIEKTNTRCSAGRWMSNMLTVCVIKAHGAVRISTSRTMEVKR